MTAKNKRLLILLIVLLAILGVKHYLQNQNPVVINQTDTQGTQLAETTSTAAPTTAALSTSSEAPTIAVTTSQSEVPTSVERPQTLDELVSAGVLTEIVKNDKIVGWQSPAGLFYGLGSKEGNRVYHVFAHLVPDESKPIHSVFDTDQQGLIDLIDEAWQNRENGYSKAQSNGNRVYDIDMGRVIGTNGESEMRIVVKDGSTSIITAYPRR